MKVKAKHTIQYGDKRIAGGSTFEASKDDMKVLRNYVELLEPDPVPAAEPEKKPAPAVKKRPTTKKG